MSEKYPQTYKCRFGDIFVDIKSLPNYTNVDMGIFIGREKELQLLEDLRCSGRAKLVVIKGRRRIGKSRLAEKFAENKKFLIFTGLAPIGTITGQDQRDVFASQLAQNLGLPPLTFKNWTDAFSHVSHYLENVPTVLLFDEISWIGSKDPTFLPKLKAWWDLIHQQYPNLTVILCGSVSIWIEKNIINSTAFFGRISLSIDLEPFSLPECALFLRQIGFKGSSYEAFKILSILGGIPWYLEQINPLQMADENIKRLCFGRNSLLLDEFDRIFYDLFHESGDTYKKIIHILDTGMKTLKEIRQSLGLSRGGLLTTLMQNLITSGFVTQHYQWSLKTEKLSRKSLYSLSDLYTRFYIKYIEQNKPKIKQDTYQDIEINLLPGWEAMMGYQVENLLLQNRPLLLKALKINPADVVADNPYCQMKTSRQKGCQIDYLIQTRTNNLFVCEFKFSRRDLRPEIINEVQEKIERFSTPRKFAVIPVLFYFGGVPKEVYDKRYFYKTVDINDFLESGHPTMVR